MFVSIEDIATGGPRRTGETVRRHSRLKGRCEGLFYRRMTRQECSQLVLAAERYDTAGKQPGDRNGPLGPVALQVLRLFVNCIDFKTGRLEPSYEYLMRKLKRSRDAIHRALKALRAHGFLDWLRRYVPTGNTGGGPQVQQTSNAYRLSLPARALALLGRLGRPAPAPEDFTHARAAMDAQRDAYRASLPMVDQIALDFGANDPMGASLARMWEGIQKRGSAKQTESQTKVL